MGIPDLERTLDLLEKDILPLQDKRMLDLALKPDVTQEEVDEVLKDWNIETAPLQSVLLLSYLLKSRPDLRCPPSMEPRLKGCLSYCRFQNLKRSAHFSKIAKALNGAGIPFMVLKGGAMKVYRPDFPRWMSDIDFLVGADYFPRAETLVADLGYTAIPDFHSTDFHLPGEKEGLVDIHRYIHMGTGHEAGINDDLFSRASLTPMYSSQGLLPCPEDMVFISLMNMRVNVTEQTSPGSVISAFFDIAWLVSSKKDFDWETVRSSALKTCSQSYLYIISRLFDRFAPGLLPSDFLAGDLSEEELSARCEHILYRRFVLAPLRLEIGEFHIPTAFRTERPIWLYVWRRARYFCLKRIYRFKPLSRRVLSDAISSL